MAGPYDVVVTIGGQSFVDGIWRLLGPALERITNPLPLALPGFANARMRVTNLVPVFPAAAATPGLDVIATVELTAEALLHVLTSSDGVSVALGPQAINLNGLTGAIDLPAQSGTLTNLLLSGGAINLGPGTGAIQMPPVTGALSGGTGTGTLSLPNSLSIPGIPIPAVVPVALDLTPSIPLIMNATVQFGVSPPSPTTRFGLLFLTSNVAVLPSALLPNLAAALTAKLQAAVDQIVAQLGIALPQAPIDPNMVTALIAPIPGLVAGALDEALTLLIAETGRLVFPFPGTGASCEVNALPVAADATLTATPNNGYGLQVGFVRAGGGGDIAAFPPLGSGTVECQVLVGNSFVLELLSCLVERLPAFVLPNIGQTQTTPHHDVNGNPHRNCRNYLGVTAAFGPFAVGGGGSDGISVCIDGQDNEAKRFTLVGKFSQDVADPLPGVSWIAPTIATVNVGFTLPLAFDLDDAASIANLRIFGTPQISAEVNPSIWLALLLLAIGALVGAATGWLGSIVFAVVAPLVAVIVILLIYLACGAASYFLGNSVRTVLAGASLVKSPVAVPPGLFEAFGRFVPASVTVDDLTASGVLHTPISPWALLPRLGIRPPRKPKGKSGKGKDPT